MQLPQDLKSSQQNIAEDNESLSELVKFFQTTYPKIEKMIAESKVVELLKLEQEKVLKQQTYERLLYLTKFDEVDIWNCYKNAFLKDVFYSLDKMNHKNRNLII